MNTEGDIVLLKRWREARDADSFNELVSRHSDMIYATCRRILQNDADAQDVAQECFFRLAQATDEIRTSLAAWLHRLARHRALNRIQSDSRRRRREKEFMANRRTDENDEWHEIERFIDEAIGELPDELRQIIVDRFFERQTYEAIAEAHRLTRRQVTYRVESGINAIREHLLRSGVSASSAVLGTLLSTRLLESAPEGLTTVLAKVALAGRVGVESEAATRLVVTQSQTNPAKPRTMPNTNALCGATSCIASGRPRVRFII